MSLILNSLKTKEKDIIENLAQSLRKSVVVNKSKIESKMIKEYRKGDE